MKFMVFLTFLISACKGGIWIASGIILRKHLDAFLSIILRKPTPENLVPAEETTELKKIFEIVGYLLMAIGIIIIVSGFTALVMGSRFSAGNFKFNF